MSKEVFIVVAGGLALATGLLFYGFHNRNNATEKEITFDDLVAQESEDESDEEEEVKPRQKRKYTKRNIQSVKTNTKRNKYK
jgi:hypothetical protein